MNKTPGGSARSDALVLFGVTGNGALFSREDAVEAAWSVVDPVLENHHRVSSYPRHSWGPKQADALIAADGRWHNPVPART